MPVFVLPAFPSIFSAMLSRGRNLPFEDRAIDIVFSNAVLEHVPGDAAGFVTRNHEA
jgi:hypothetical protein